MIIKKILGSSVTFATAVALIGVGATGAFFSDSELSEGNILVAGAVDLQVDHSYFAYNGEECETVCEPDTETNLIQNGSFEDGPTIAPAVWALFADGVVPNWSVSWEPGQATSYDGFTRPALGQLEVHESIPSASPAAEGERHVELSSDWFGPGAPFGEPSLIEVAQEVTLVPGQQYELRYAYAPRPNLGVSAADNTLYVRIDGTQVQSQALAGGNGSLDPVDWNDYSYTFVASATNTTISFAAGGTPDGAGTLLDDVRLYPIECESAPIENGMCMLWEEKDLVADSDFFFNFSDIKPYDEGRNVISLHVYDNDAWSCLLVDDVVDDENEVWEPEEPDTEPEGELSEYLSYVTWSDDDADALFEPGDGEVLLGQGLFGDGAPLASMDSTNGEYLAATNTRYVGLAWCAGQIAVAGDGTISCDGSFMQNDAQSDTLTASLVAYAEQMRNNSGFVCGGTPAAAPSVARVDSSDAAWGFAAETGDGAGQYVLGPGGAPLGSGSAELALDSSDDGVVFGTLQFAGTRLDALTNLGYTTYRSAGGAALAPSLQLEFDDDVTDGDTAWKGRLVYEPYFTHTVLDTAWQDWDTLDDAPGGNWWFSSWGPGQADCSQANPCTWSEVLAYYPDAGVRDAGPGTGGVLFKAGSGWPLFTGNVDAFVWGVNGTDTIFNFEL